MRALIVGGDTVETVRRQLAARGYDQVEHWEGRKTGDCRRTFPRRIDLVVVMLGYVNHNLCKRVRQEALRQDWPVEYFGRKVGAQPQKAAA
ncbi:MAG: DUF2325 domain-containing protein [Paludibacterium sp.]|uniref:DUF2325 domain-containing protein n=1 Tax=Paludibacterium sp. TaxID=1917523 RepID=UPI0025CD223A|nr:DUF2325 domain-containing protein [Paludibacterium sp.]MBV8047053.1 DUF2325 domain-containing protein [Paludibacterium sp.]MBV8646411.1 DUF2325 domain-containing protein [Paludibacterium sp.]